MLSPATKPPGRPAAPHSLCSPGQRVRRPRARIEFRLTSGCSSACGISRPRVSLVAVRDLASRRFSTSLPQPFRRLSGVRSEDELRDELRYQLRDQLGDQVLAFGMSCFADGCAGFRRSRGFDISTTSDCDRSIALLAARTSRVVVARRRLSPLVRRVVPAPDSPARRTDGASRCPSTPAIPTGALSDRTAAQRQQHHGLPPGGAAQPGATRPPIAVWSARRRAGQLARARS